MRRLHSIRLVAAFTSYLLTVSFSYALNETISGWYGIFGQSAGQEIYGQYVNSESYSRLGTSEDYDPGYLEYFWDWHLRSETQVTNSQGTVTASSQTPNSVGAWMENGGITFNLNGPVQASAWTNTQSIYSPDAAETVDISFYHGSSFNFPVGIEGSLTIYFGIWENDAAIDNLILDEKDGWILSQLNFDGQTYPLLQNTFTSFSEANSTWSLNLQAANDYQLFTYMIAETVPEPATLMLLGWGIILIRRNKRPCHFC